MVQVWVRAGLELEVFAAEEAGVDEEGARGRGARGEGVGEEGVVVGWGGGGEGAGGMVEGGARGWGGGVAVEGEEEAFVGEGWRVFGHGCRGFWNWMVFLARRASKSEWLVRGSGADHSPLRVQCLGTTGK